MAQMHKPWPSPEQAVDLPVEDLARHVLDRVASTPPDRFGGPLTRNGFINAEVTDAVAAERARPNRVTQTTSQEARELRPELVHAYAEAWDHCERQGWLAGDPGRPGAVFITRRGNQTLADYRSDRCAGSDNRQVSDTPRRAPAAQPNDQQAGSERPAALEARGAQSAAEITGAGRAAMRVAADGSSTPESGSAGAGREPEPGEGEPSGSGTGRRNKWIAAWIAVVAVATGVVAITGAVIGVAEVAKGAEDLVDNLFGDDDSAVPAATPTPEPPRGDPPRSPVERLSRTAAQSAPSFEGRVRHYERASRLIGFLRRHDGDAVELHIRVPLWPHGLDAGSIYSERGAERNIALRRKCPSWDQAGRDCGVLLFVFTRTTDDARVGASDGHAHLSGYFGVDATPYGSYQMGYTVIRLKPLALG
jgi:hypothetical protein